ncbi:MAG: FKBP-type peptidyl-prolyl cis-trans isomerase SlyD [Candidatus Binatota bacterium]|jgi:FKBP-type peptidyl-prolyl cis-trans isomerase SlyD|nr:FKBP-type peptidyl-prolyl cis-trans isomerase SlyD [Candidatus Binatota bacterium]
MRPHLSTRLASVLLLALSAAAPASGDDAAASPDLRALKGTAVSIEYTVTDENGKPIEDTAAGDAIVYHPGRRELPPTLEQALHGLRSGDEKDVRLTPEQGYGPVDPKALLEVRKSEVPEGARKAGALLRTRGADGRAVTVRVREVKKETVVVDFNHPMAGKTLLFHVKVVDVRPASPAPAPGSGPAAKGK